MSIAEKLTTIAENEQKVYDAGYEKGKAEGGGNNQVVPPNDVTFYDYDGKILYSYTVEEAQNLTELPELPKRDGLICQGWNYTLEEIKSHNRALNIGAMYITDDGKTRLYITIDTDGRMTVPLYFGQTVANGVIIDWGDGSAKQTFDTSGVIKTSHTYTVIGDYIIKLEVNDNCTLTLGSATTNECMMGVITDKTNGGPYFLQKVEIGKNVNSINYATFKNCYYLKCITIPDSVKNLEDYLFQYCYSLNCIVIPNSITKLSKAGTFESCNTLKTISIPNSVVELSGNYIFQAVRCATKIILPNSITSLTGSSIFSNNSLMNVFIPKNVLSIPSSTFSSCTKVKYYDFSEHTAVPRLVSVNAFNGYASDMEIRVPIALVDQWKAATNWSTYADNIVGV